MLTWFQPYLKVIKRSKFYDTVIGGLVLINVVVLMLFGTTLSGSNTVQGLAWFFVIFNLVETGFRIVTSGFAAFLMKNSASDPFRRAAHRWDFLTSCLIVLFLILRSSSDNFYLLLHKFVFAFPLMRLMTIVPLNKRVFFGLFMVIQGLSHLVLFLFVVIYTYGSFGVLLFSGLLNLDQHSLGGIDSFNSLAESMATLFQVIYTHLTNIFIS